MRKELLTALASYCNNPKCKWASLDEEANIQAKALYEEWTSTNIWRQPWDGFIAIVKKQIPTASKITKFYEGENVLILFSWYGDTWAICS